MTILYQIYASFHFVLVFCNSVALNPIPSDELMCCITVYCDFKKSLFFHTTIPVFQWYCYCDLIVELTQPDTFMFVQSPQLPFFIFNVNATLNLAACLVNNLLQKVYERKLVRKDNFLIRK